MKLSEKEWALTIIMWVLAILAVAIWSFNIGSIYYTRISAQSCEEEL